MSRAERTAYQRQHDLVQAFLNDMSEVCGGNPNQVIGGCTMALLSVLSQIHNGNAESVALNFERLIAEVAEQVRDGALTLGVDPQ